MYPKAGNMNEIKNLKKTLEETGFVMPVLFIGHGSPMNGIEDNEFSRNWSELAKEIPVPKAVIVISAHWFTKGTQITAMDFPKTIHDFGGFPKALFDVQYPAPGNPVLAKETAQLIQSTEVFLSHEWGLDHGTWTIIRHMYPDANIPVLQLSIDYTKPPVFHYQLGKEIYDLRNRGVLIIGSGNMVHNLGMVAWDRLNENNYGYEWAQQTNQLFKKLILEKDHTKLIRYNSLGTSVNMSVPTPEHYLPLLYTLALQNKNDDVSFFNDKAVGGSITMTSVKIG